MKNEVYYVKSLEEDFTTKTIKNKRKVSFQTIQNIIKTKAIKPNTKSFGRERRLSCTMLSKSYIKTYRPHGIVFQTEERPSYIFPFDLVLLSATDRIIVHYYRIKNNLHVYYNHTLIPGFEKFIFKDLHSMIQKYPSPRIVWKEVNKFRVKNGYKVLPDSKYRLVEYNEAVFHKTIKINPIALFGYLPQTRKIARQLHLSYFVSAKHFYDKFNHEK